MIEKAIQKAALHINSISQKHKLLNILSAFPNFIANVSCFASSSAKSAGVFHTNALSLEQCGCRFILGNTVIVIKIKSGLYIL